MADHEGELELELEDEFNEGEGEEEAGSEGEGWLGALRNIAGSLLGESEYELEAEDELEFQLKQFPPIAWLTPSRSVEESFSGQFSGADRRFLKGSKLALRKLSASRPASSRFAGTLTNAPDRHRPSGSERSA